MNLGVELQVLVAVVVERVVLRGQGLVGIGTYILTLLE